MQLHFAKAYIAFLKASVNYRLLYQPADTGIDNSSGEMWLKRNLVEQTNDQGQCYLTLQAPFSIVLDQEKEDGLNSERLNEKLETVETLNTLGERGVVGERLSAFPEQMTEGDKICLFKRAIFDRSVALAGGATRIVEMFAPTDARSHWLTISDHLYGKESVDYAGGSSMIFKLDSPDHLTLQYLTFSGPSDSSLLTFRVIERQPIQ